MRFIRAVFILAILFNILTCGGCDWAKAQFAGEKEKERRDADGLWYGGGDPDLERWKRETEERGDRRQVIGSSGVSARKKGGGKGGTGEGLGGGLGLVLMVIGARQAKAKKWRWGLLLLGGGLILCIAGFGWQVPGFSWWKIIMGAVWIPMWAYSLTTKTQWDDRLIKGTSMAIIVASLLGRIIPALGPGDGWFQTLPSITWGALQAACVFGVVPGLWDHLGKMDSWGKFLRLAPFWILLLVTQ